MKRTNEASKLAGVSRRTLQYYDDEGLLMAERSSDNHRLYDRQVLERLWEILIYKEMDFELKDIRKLLKLSDEQKRQYLDRKTDEIRNQIISRHVQIGFILMVKDRGMPAVPEENNGKTYVQCVEELRMQIREKIMRTGIDI